MCSADSATVVLASQDHPSLLSTQLEAELSKLFVSTGSEISALAINSSLGVSAQAVNSRFKRYGKSLKQRYKEKFYNQVATEVRNTASSWFTQKAYDAYKSMVPESATSAQCIRMESEMETMDDHFTYFVRDPMEKIDEWGTEIVDNCEKLKEEEANLISYSRTLGALKTSCSILSTVLSAVGVTAPAGAVFKTIGRAMDVTKRALDQVKNGLVSFNDRVTEPLQEKVEIVLEKNAEVSEKIETGTERATPTP